MESRAKRSRREEPVAASRPQRVKKSPKRTEEEVKEEEEEEEEEVVEEEAEEAPARLARRRVDALESVARLRARRKSGESVSLARLARLARNATDSDRRASNGPRASLFDWNAPWRRNEPPPKNGRHGFLI